MYTFEANLEAPNDKAREAFVPRLKDSGFTEAEAALIFDLAWQAQVEAQATIYRVLNRVPDELRLAAAGVSAYMLEGACRTFGNNVEQLTLQAWSAELLRRMLGGTPDAE
jgi:hypothetical protein